MQKRLLLIVLLLVTAASNPVNGSETLRLVTYNVWYGFTKAPARKASWLEWMKAREPDVVCLQELNGYTAAQLAKDAATWGHRHSVLLKEDGFATGVTSDSPIDDVQRLRHGFHHGLMRVHTAGFYLYVVHLHPSNWETRNREVALLLQDVKRLPAGSRIVLAGDFNTFSTRDRSHYDAHPRLLPFFAERDRRFGEQNLREGQLDFAVIRQIEEAGFVDLEARFRKAISGTFPTQIEKPGDHGDPRRLDYVFANPTMAQRCVDAYSVVDEATATLSDHYPVIADFRRDDRPDSR